MSTAIQLTQTALAAPKDLKGVFELEPFQRNFIGNLVKTNGKTEEAATMIFEREKILFMKAVAANPQLEQCDRFSIYSSFIELAVSGLSLNEGHTYIIPYGKKAQFQIGYKGRVEQMQQIQAFKFVRMPQVVYTSDEFDYELGEMPRVIMHKPARNRPATDVIEFVYLVIEKLDGKNETYLMTREEVINIRDHYSKPYIEYMNEIRKQNKKVGDKVTKTGKRRDGSSYTVDLDPPMWVTSEAEAFKKTIVKRAYKWVPKTAIMKALDEKIKDNVDIEDGTGGDEKTVDIEYNFVADGAAPAKTATTATRAPKTKKDAAAPTPPPAQENKSSVSNEDLGAMRGEDTQDVSHSEVTEDESGDEGSGLPDLTNPDF